MQDRNNSKGGPVAGLRKGRTLRRAALLVAALCGSSAWAGPTFEFGEEGSITLSYALQVWGQARNYTSSNDSGSTWDTYLRRNRITLAGQANDYVGFYAQLESGNDSKGGWTTAPSITAMPMSPWITRTRCVSSSDASRTPSRVKVSKRAWSP
ncbi:hypothetical protein [Candidatus Dactylopiibacterium carminicum]|uniref:hypothetical protein n=1 Tax=Candidatus Dactylopiibacterium carminicum TaxID=857335 RepID=UPI001CC2D865|nr:hypothetical protein [Candidatus Dactylopiibacterium carminicum]